MFLHTKLVLDCWVILLPLFNVQITWTAHMGSTMIKAKGGEEVLVSYLPLSHIAAQMVDVWVCMVFAGTAYFAEPDALKVSMTIIS